MADENPPAWQPIWKHDGSTDECLIGIFDESGLYVADRGWWEPGETDEEWDEIEDGVMVKLWESEGEGRWTSNHLIIDEPTHFAILEARKK